MATCSEVEVVVGQVLGNGAVPQHDPARERMLGTFQVASHRQKPRPEKGGQAEILQRCVDPNGDLLQIPAHLAKGVGFHAQALDRARTVDLKADVVVPLQAGGHQPAAQIGMAQGQGFQDAETMVGAHLVDHPGSLQDRPPNPTGGQNKDVQAVFGAGQQLFLQGVAVYFFLDHEPSSSGITGSRVRSATPVRRRVHAGADKVGLYRMRTK